MNTIKLAPLILIFAEVAKAQSFTGAAKKLNMSKSAVSLQIKRLETELDMQLLARNTRGVVLTQMGEVLLKRSSLLSEQLANVLSDIDANKSQPSGRFALSVPPFFERHIIVPALEQLCLEYPMLQPELTITGRWQDLIEHDLDVAIFGGDLKACDYKAQSIGKVQDIFCASPRYIAQHGEPVELADLSQHKYIATPWQSGTVNLQTKSKSAQKLNDSELTQACDLTQSQAAFTNSVSTLLDMTLAGMGIGLVPEFLAKADINRGHLQQVLPQHRGREWHFYLLHRYGRNKPKHIERFYQLVVFYFVGQVG